MDPAILTTIIQGVIQIATIIGGMWTLFNKQKQNQQEVSKRLERVELRMYQNSKLNNGN